MKKIDSLRVASPSFFSPLVKGDLVWGYEIPKGCGLNQWVWNLKFNYPLLCPLSPSSSSISSSFSTFSTFALPSCINYWVGRAYTLWTFMKFVTCVEERRNQSITCSFILRWHLFLESLFPQVWEYLVYYSIHFEVGKVYAKWDLLLWRIVPFAILWPVWKEWNNKIFRDESMSKEDLLSMITLRIAKWALVILAWWIFYTIGRLPCYVVW